MTIDQLRRYAAVVGASFETFQFDGGLTIAMTHGGNGFRDSEDWGGIDRLYRSATKWLNNLPWPTEDDPRVENTGAYA